MLALLAVGINPPGLGVPVGSRRIVATRPVSFRHSKKHSDALRALFKPGADDDLLSKRKPRAPDPKLMCDAEAVATPVEERDFRDRAPPPPPELAGFTDAEIKFLRSITESEPDWAAVKAKMPSLAKFEDEQLRTAWVNSGTDISALWKTPVGPVLIINLILWATGASWCDTPLGVAEACMGR